jgi:hypothetical protein
MPERGSGSRSAVGSGGLRCRCGCSGGGDGAVPFVGRDRELARVAGLLDGARAGRGRLLLCTGGTGIGKTRLAGETAAMAAARGAAVAWRPT